MGGGPPKSMFRQKSEGETATLLMEEGKSKYMSNPFWASISEVSYSFHQSTQF